MMLKSMLAAAFCSVLPVAVSAAPVQSSGNLTLVSDYLYRGISQTNEGPALQGQLTLNQQDGWYLTAWGSNIKFGDGSLELDLSAGRTFALNDDWSLDLGLMKYFYPKGHNSSNGYNFVEAYGKLIYGQANLMLAVTDDYFGTGVSSFAYLSGDYTQDLTDNLQLVWHLGYNHFDGAEDFQLFLGAAQPDQSAYTDWSLKLQSSWADIQWALGYADTSVSSAACSALCDKRWVLSASKSF